MASLILGVMDHNLELDRCQAQSCVRAHDSSYPFGGYAHAVLPSLDQCGDQAARS